MIEAKITTMEEILSISRPLQSVLSHAKEKYQLSPKSIFKTWSSFQVQTYLCMKVIKNTNNCLQFQLL